MTSAELLVDAVGRIRGVVHRVVDSLTPEQLAFRVDPKANSIAWLVWHLTRIQDDHVADVAQAEQVWTSQGWVERFGLPFDPGTPATGTGPIRWRPCRWSPASCWWATTMRSTSRRPGTWSGSVRPTWPASWTGPGIRRCRWACGWSA
jgi:hypothetical protein